ncbi:hypothetical protein [Sphingomicrobium astaxanthinifaciens]|uniref:hypothetical protein n=1 Tax=Sphingomicrobium astaxanthinifaciens TaxID=1227949 RepID=UPI001FCA9A72|nr:hypothetical protein [Sphingomicrobium astaxanthinifaciens]MCJ7421339.1 hypothetical protein [Sphingomicrobium astaxanthinifaciens]
MSVIAYVSVFVSIILGVALADLAASTHRLIVARARVRWDWRAPALALIAVLQLVGIWWASFDWYVDAERLGLAAFMVDFALLFLLYLLAAAALPDAVDDRLDLRAFYTATAPYFWSVLGLVFLLVAVALAPRLVPGLTLGQWARQQAFNLVQAGLCFALARWSAPRLHAVAIPLLLLLFAASYWRLAIG